MHLYTYVSISVCVCNKLSNASTFLLHIVANCCLFDLLQVNDTSDPPKSTKDRVQYTNATNRMALSNDDDDNATDYEYKVNII